MELLSDGNVKMCASLVACYRWWVTARSVKIRKKTGQKDRRTDGRLTVTLRLALDTAGVMMKKNKNKK